MAVIISTVNASEYNEILDNFLVPRMENWFSDEKVIFSGW